LKPGRFVAPIPDSRPGRLEAVDLAGEPRRQRRAAFVRPFRDFARRAGRIAGDDRLELVAADDVPALAERVDVTIEGLDVLDARAGNRQQLKLNRQEGLNDDVQPL